MGEGGRGLVYGMPGLIYKGIEWDAILQILLASFMSDISRA